MIFVSSGSKKDRKNLQTELLPRVLLKSAMQATLNCPNDETPVRDLKPSNRPADKRIDAAEMREDQTEN